MIANHFNIINTINIIKEKDLLLFLHNFYNALSNSYIHIIMYMFVEVK